MDKLLKMVFEEDRWSYALDKAFDKKIKIAELDKLLRPETRAALYCAIRDDKYDITPPRQQLIPKDNGEYRTVYICSNIDRVFLSIVNDLLFELCSSMVHRRCMSYQKGLSCGKVVKEMSRTAISCSTNEIGFKSDLSKYFDTIRIEYIDKAFDDAESIFGKSKVIDVLRRFYHRDLCIDLDGNLVEHYFSLGQGVATASWLADVILYDVDELCSKHKGYYVRYSDDICYLGDDWKIVFEEMKNALAAKHVTLNPKKVETLHKNKYFKFLGFSIRGSEISLSKSRLKTFQKEIERLSIRNYKASYKSALHQVMNFLYGNIHSNMQYSWATSVLSVINVKEDIETLNQFVMDCLRAVSTGKRKVGGLGYEPDKKVGVITRGRGKNVTSNQNKTEKLLQGYLPLMQMRNALITSKDVYEALRRTV